MDYKTLWNSFVNWLMQYAPKVLAALVVFLVGWLLVKMLLKVVAKALKRSKISVSLHVFLLSVIKISLLVVVLITCLSILGVPMTSIVTTLGAVGLAVSLAVKDSLSNLAGSMILLFTSPFRVGDYIETDDGISGTVQEIGMFHTKLSTPDNKDIFLPNGELSNDRIINYSYEKTRRLDLTFSIDYNDSFEKAKSVISQVVQKHPFALKQPEPIIRMCEHANDSIRIACRVWVESPHYWDLNFDLLEQVKEAFDQNGINIPYPQLDVHFKDQKLNQEK